jgi:hypothetical protein
MMNIMAMNITSLNFSAVNLSAVNLSAVNLSASQDLLLRRTILFYVVCALLCLLYTVYVHNKIMNDLDKLEITVNDVINRQNELLLTRIKKLNETLDATTNTNTTEPSIEEYDDFGLSSCARGVGPIYACQECIKLYIKDKSNVLRSYVRQIYKWLGTVECTIDELSNLSIGKTEIILRILERYKPETTDSNLLMNYGEALSSLKYQMEQYANQYAKTNN